MRNQYQALSLFTLLAVSCVLTSCASPDKSAGKEDKEKPTAMTEAPLGSRIKRKSTINPVSGATREQIEQQRVMQGTIQNAVANDPGKYGNSR